MSHYVLYNNDQPVARFDYTQGMIRAYEPVRDELLPMQICAVSADGFTGWIRERAIDLNTVQHRNLVSQMLGSRDKVHLALMTHMFSISDTFTCFEEGEFTPRRLLCNPDEHEAVSNYILLTSDTSLRKAVLVTPNVSTDGSFTKTWKYEDGEWWLYKLQPSEATRSEVEISRVLRACDWDAAEYQYVGSYRKRIRSRNSSMTMNSLSPTIPSAMRFRTSARMRMLSCRICPPLAKRSAWHGSASCLPMRCS